MAITSKPSYQFTPYTIGIKTTHMIKIKVTGFDLTDTHIICTLSDGKHDCEYKVDKEEYEEWLTDGTGLVDMGFAHHNGGAIQEVDIKTPVDEYWTQAKEVNESPAVDHLQLYVTRDELNRSLCRAELLEQHLKDLFDTHMEGLTKAEAYASLIEYGIVLKEAGEQLAGQAYKRIIASRSL